MSETISGDNSSTAVVDNPSGTQEAVNETATTDGQAGGAPTEDIFKGVDPAKLPPELKAAYNSMLTDYRTKTASIKETIKTESQKATEAYRQKAELYDSIAQQEEFVKRWNDYVQETQTKGNNPQAGDPVLTEMKQKLDEMSQKIQLSELSQVTDAFAEAVNEKGEKIHPEFDALNSVMLGSLKNGPQSEEFSLLRGCIELSTGNSPQERLSNGYKTAKAVYDSIFEAGKKSGMGRVQAKVMNGTNPPSNSSGEVLSVTDRKPKNAHEALAMAKRGQMVSRE